MLRAVGRLWIWRACCRFSDTVPLPKESKQEKKLPKYLVFPVKAPVFPHYTYYTRINQVLCDLIKQNNCKYVVALPLREDAVAKEFFPKNVEELTDTIGRELV